MLVSFIISTFNRREVLLRTLERIRNLGLAGATYEIHVIDNASTDGTAEAIAKLDDVRHYPEKLNRGSCAKNVAIPFAHGEYLVFLDDDSYPLAGSIERMIRHFEHQPQLGAATFTITLPDGSSECSAYPNVVIGCGVGLRRSAIEQVGGLPEDFFMQAEEYDLSLRLLDAGWKVRTFDDLHVTHLKTPLARTPKRTMRLDVRNNLMLVWRYFPADYAMPFCMDWLGRYWMIARAQRQRSAFLIGLVQGLLQAFRRHRRPVSASAFEMFAKINLIRKEMMLAQDRHRARTVLLIDLGKNIFPYWLAAQICGLSIVAIADNRLARNRYRGVRIVSDDEARQISFDLAIVSNSSPVHAKERARTWRSIQSRPVVDLLETPLELPVGVAA